MPVLAGNLTTLALTDDTALTTLFPTLNTYLPLGVTDWSAQRAEGLRAAQSAFRIITGKDPVRAKAVVDSDWDHILAAFGLATVFLGFIHPGAQEEWKDHAAAWQERAELAIKQLVYQYDEDESGVLDTTTQEDEQRVGEIRLVR